MFHKLYFDHFPLGLRPLSLKLQPLSLCWTFGHFSKPTLSAQSLFDRKFFCKFYLVSRILFKKILGPRPNSLWLPSCGLLVKQRTEHRIKSVKQCNLSFNLSSKSFSTTIFWLWCILTFTQNWSFFVHNSNLYFVFQLFELAYSSTCEK